MRKTCFTQKTLLLPPKIASNDFIAWFSMPASFDKHTRPGFEGCASHHYQGSFLVCQGSTTGIHKIILDYGRTTKQHNTTKILPGLKPPHISKETDSFELIPIFDNYPHTPVWSYQWMFSVLEKGMDGSITWCAKTPITENKMAWYLPRDPITQTAHYFSNYSLRDPSQDSERN